MKTLLVSALLVLSAFAVVAASPTASACVSWTTPGCNWHCTYVNGACVPTPNTCIKICTNAGPGPCPAMPFAPVNAGYVSIQFPACGGAPTVTVHPSWCEIGTTPCNVALA